ncbi:MAG: hypothetical protein AAFU85_26935 [Planctomycetota bacterium]
MGLFERKRFVWNEPWFFQQRIRTVKAWSVFGLVLLLLGGALGIVLFWSTPQGAAPNWFEIIGMSLGFPAAVWYVLDGTETRRQAILFNDSIVVGGDMGKYSTPTKYHLSQIDAMAIVMPEESKWPERALFFVYEGEEQAIGIDSKVSLPRLAQTLHDTGMTIRLDGWEPDQESEFAKAFSWTNAGEIKRTAKLETLPDGTVGIMNPLGIIVAIVRQCWAISLWLLVAGVVGYFAYQNWGNLGLVRMVLMFVLVLGLMYVAGVFTDRFATASTSKGLIKMAKDQMRKRESVQIDLDSEELIAVELFLPDQFDKTIQKVHEMGFIQADHAGSRMLFEGKKQRWSIPSEAIRSISIQEVQTGSPGQSATGMLNYYVVVTFADTEDNEIGFRHSDRDYGEFDDIKRAKGGIEVYEAFEELLSQQA